MRKPKTIKAEILRTEKKLQALKEELHDVYVADAIKTVESWRPDLRLMLGPPPQRVKPHA